MSFLDTVRRARAYLEEQGRVSLGALKLEFDLDDARLEALVEELADVQQVAAREGKLLTWLGGTSAEASRPQPETRAIAEAPPDPAETPPASEAERRQLTVFFCDLVDSSRLASAMDPEDWREVVRGYQDTAAKVVERFEGHVAQYLGDGLLVYFGYPRAHEDDPERAVRAGRELLDELNEGNAALERDRAIRLSARIGVHTGPVVVGQTGGGDRHEVLAMGETTNIAARLQERADPDTLVISEATRRLTHGLFISDDLGELALKGIAKPVSAHRVQLGTGVRSRFDAASSSFLSPFVGRQRELGLLLDRWEQVQEGVGQVVLISGEAGIGKSRLIQMMREELREVPHGWLECGCSPYTQDSALHPVTAMLEQALSLGVVEEPEQRFVRLERAHDHLGFDLPETMPLFASLLSLPLPDRYQAPTGSPEFKRRRTVEILLEWLFQLGRLQPLVLLVEDLHWADPSSLELMRLLVEQVPTAPVLAVLTHRPDFSSPLPTRSHVTPVTLGRLARRHVAQMVDELAGANPIPAQIASEIVERADGVPLFAEELTKSVIESGVLRKDTDKAGASGAIAIPATLQDSLMARLDRLSPVKEVAQLAATLGREFSFELLQAVSPLEEGELHQGLDQLVQAEILYQRGSAAHATYTFKHALMQETAYQSLLKARRQQFHQRIAEVLDKRFADQAVRQPEMLAHHFMQGGIPERALPLWQEAGARAIQRSANVEAERHLRRGLDALDILSDGPERQSLELGLRTLLGIALIATEGYGADRVAKNFRRALAVSEALGETPGQFPVLFGIWEFALVRSEPDEAPAVAERVFRLAQSSGDPRLSVEGRNAMGITACQQGRLTEAEQHLEAARSLYDPALHRQNVFLHGQDPGVFAYLFSALTAWFRGFPNAGLGFAENALVFAKASNHPFTQAGAYMLAAIVRTQRRESEAACELADAAIALSKEQGFPLWMGGSMMVRALTLVDRGQSGEAIEEFDAALAATRSTGNRAFFPYGLGLAAEGSARLGRIDEAQRFVDEGLEAARATLDRQYEAELHRLQGEVALARSDVDQARACFERALAVAREQGARSLELRGAMSLARLLEHEGRRDEARGLLRPVYDWFTEGFDTRDLKDAKALLDELA